MRTKVPFDVDEIRNIRHHIKDIPIIHQGGCSRRVGCLAIILLDIPIICNLVHEGGRLLGVTAYSDVDCAGSFLEVCHQV